MHEIALLPEHQPLPVWKHSGSKRERFGAVSCVVRRKDDAAEGGHPAVLRWACANGCPWDEQTCSSAAFGAHLELLQWARANGCPWDEKACSMAAMGI